MAQTLNKIGITDGNPIESFHVTQSIDALTGIEAYDITLSGSFEVTGSSRLSEVTGSSFTGSFIGEGSGLTNISNATTSSLSTFLNTSYCKQTSPSTSIPTSDFRILAGAVTLSSGVGVIDAFTGELDGMVLGTNCFITYSTNDVVSGAISFSLASGIITITENPSLSNGLVTIIVAYTS